MDQKIKSVSIDLGSDTTRTIQVGKMYRGVMIMNMEVLYGNAYLTVVAYNGSEDVMFKYYGLNIQIDYEPTPKPPLKPKS